MCHSSAVDSKTTLLTSPFGDSPSGQLEWAPQMGLARRSFHPPLYDWNRFELETDQLKDELFPVHQFNGLISTSGCAYGSI